jgi:predicted metal-dependent TIM-barrel fold hydrolase
MAEPTKRPLGLWSDDVDDRGRDQIRELPPELTNLPWIDPHQHVQTLSYEDRERLDWSGCNAVIMIATNYHWSPYRPVDPDDVRFLWDLALRWTDHINNGHFFDTYTAIGIHTLARVDDYDDVLDVLPDYCDHESVVAIGESGIEPVQYSTAWELDDQRRVVRRQMEVAEDQSLPFILHTPAQKTTSRDVPKLGWREYTGVFTEPRFEHGEETKLKATEMDVELKDEAGLADERLVVDHADSSIVPYVMENTDCYLGFTVGYPERLRKTNSEDIAGAIETYGPDRILIDSDLAGSVPTDPFSVKRTILELYNLGIDEEDIRTVVYDNPKRVFGLG